MPLVIDPDASQCDVCLETYREGGQVTPVVLACGHVLCKECSQSIGASCHLCRGWFNRDRTIKLHVDYGPSNESAAHKARAIEVRLTQLSGVHDVHKIQNEANSIIQWLDAQEGAKPPILRTYCELVLKLCSVTEAKTIYRDRARDYESKLMGHKDESHAKILELTTKLDEANRVIQAFQQPQVQTKVYSPERPSNPLPAPPEPVDYMFDMSPKYDANLEPHPMSGSAASISRRSSRQVNTRSKDKEKEKESDLKGKSSSKRLFSRSGTSSRQRSDNEGGGGSIYVTPYTHTPQEMLGASDTEGHSLHHRTPSKSQDNLTSSSSQSRSKPRSYSHGESSANAEPEYGAHNDPFLNISSKPRDAKYNTLSGYRYPTSASTNTTAFPHRATSDEVSYSSHSHSQQRRSSDDVPPVRTRRTSSLGHGSASTSSKYVPAPYSAPAETYSQVYAPSLSHAQAQASRRYSSIPYNTSGYTAADVRTASYHQPHQHHQSSRSSSQGRGSGYATTTDTSRTSHQQHYSHQPSRSSSQTRGRPAPAPPVRQPSVAHSRTSSQGQVDPMQIPQETIILASIAPPAPFAPSSTSRPMVVPRSRGSETVVHPRMEQDGYASQDDRQHRSLRRSSSSRVASSGAVA